MAPPLAEHEKGFELWLSKIAVLAKELTLPMLVHCNEATDNAIRRALQRAKLSPNLNVQHFDEWEDVLVLSRHISDHDLLVLVSARRGAASYLSVLDGLPNKLEKYFGANNRIVVYPQQFTDHHGLENYTDFSSEPLTIGLETVQKIGKGLGNIFK